MIWCRCGHTAVAHYDGRGDCAFCKCPYYRPTGSESGYDFRLTVAKESIPPFVDKLDTILAIYIAEAMLGEEETCVP